MIESLHLALIPFLLFFVGEMSIVLVSHRVGRGRFGIGKLFVGLAHVCVVSLFINYSFARFLNARVDRLPEQLRAYYDFIFEESPLPFSPGSSLMYQEHHYLNYALNPLSPYGLKRQFNDSYLIRRGEPIRPRDKVERRILVLGGSTAFGEQIEDEEKTWVWLLESKIRALKGPQWDVINGAVGGYTVLENLIHYVTLTSSLSPDIVLLFEGINDVHPRFFGELRSDYGNYRKPWRSSGNVLPEPISFLKWLAPYRYYYLENNIQSIVTGGIGGLAAKPYPAESQWDAAVQRNGVEIYRDHLDDLVKLIIAQGRVPVIIPQQFRIREGNHRDEIFYSQVVEHNKIGAKIAQDEEIPILEGLSISVFDAENFIDNCHLNVQGHQAMAEAVFRGLKEKLLLDK